jgi:hypothetical protein
VSDELPYVVLIEDFASYPAPNQVAIRTAALRFRRLAHGKMT